MNLIEKCGWCGKKVEPALCPPYVAVMCKECVERVPRGKIVKDS